MSSLSDKTLKGVLWTSLAQGGSLVLVLSYNIVMARLLSPQDFGLFGMAVVFTGLMGVIFSLGLGIAIIQRQDIGEETYTAVFWVNLLLGCTVGAAVFFGAPFVAGYFGEARLAPMLRFMSVNALLGSFSSVPAGLLAKRMEFRKQTGAVLLAMALAFPAAILFALGGFGPWSIVFGNTLQTALVSVFMWRAASWRPRRAFAAASLRPVIGFGLFKSLLAAGEYFTRSVDLFLVGKFLGAEALGFYTIAITLAKAPAQKVRNIIGLVAFPAFAKIQNEKKRVERNFHRAARAAALVLMPFFAVLFLFATETISVLYGAKWAASIPVLRVLLFYTLLRSLSLIAQTILMATGRAGGVLAVFVVETTVLGALIMTALPGGLGAVAAAVGLAAAAGLGVRLFLLARAVDLRLGMMIRSLAGPVLANGLVLAVLWAVKARLAHPVDSLPAFILLAGGAALLHLGADWLVMNERERADALSLFVRAPHE